MLVVADPEVVKRQTVALSIGAKESIGVLAAMVVLLATNAVPAAVASLLAACAIVLIGVLTIDRPSGRSRGPRSSWWPG